MCVGLPGRVVEIVDADHHIVKVVVAGETHDVNAAILRDEDVRVGDWLELHMGMAMAKLTEEQARETIAFMDELDAAHRGELVRPPADDEPA